MVLSLSNMWKRKLLKKAESASESETHYSSGGSTLDRRSFLRGGACMVAGAVAGIKVANFVDEGVSGAVELTPSAPSDSTYEETPIIDTATSNNTARSIAEVTSEPEDDLRSSNKQDDSPPLEVFKDSIRCYEEGFTEAGQSLIKSIGQGFLAIVAGQGVAIPLQAMGVPTGNASMKELLNDPELLSNLSLSRLMLLTSVSAPIEEEIIFRFAPAAALNLVGRKPKKGQTDLIPAVLTSAAFAQAHNIGAEDKTLPVTQFAFGMANWSINRTNGLAHAIAAHSAVNTAVAGAVSLSVLKERRDLLKQDQSDTNFNDTHREYGNDLPPFAQSPVQPETYNTKLTAREDFKRRAAELFDDFDN